MAPATEADRDERTVGALEESGFTWDTDIEAYVLTALNTPGERDRMAVDVAVLLFGCFGHAVISR